MASCGLNDKCDNEGGYEVNLDGPIPDRLKCQLCKKLMRNPIQTIRGELACGQCYTNALGSSSVCPIDQDPISSNEYFNDNFKTREIGNLRCACVNAPYGCDWRGTVESFQKHQFNCSYQARKCPLCHGNIVYDKTVEDHLTECQQIIAKNVCFYAKYGCPVKPSNSKEHITHLKDEAFIHSIMQNNWIESTQSGNTSLRNQLDIATKSAQEETSKMSEEIKLLNEQILSLSSTVKETQENYKVLLESTSIRQIDSNIVSARTELTEAAILSPKVAAMSKMISEIDLKQQLYENTTYNGKILWKIDNFNFRMQQAVTGRVTALHSAPCFTEKYGYRFCGRVYLNGDGMGKCTHLSMFFVVMKSEYDNLLNWPFTRRITFRLINQEDESKSVFESFTPDRFSSSFQKAKKEMNVAAGCPMFISKDDLTSNGFVKDDAIFIEISVA